jgi:hypothetical protein
MTASTPRHDFDGVTERCPHPDCGGQGRDYVTGWQCAECGHYFPRPRVAMGDDSEPYCRGGMGHNTRRPAERSQA